jgi:hypothetical protein
LKRLTAVVLVVLSLAASYVVGPTDRPPCEDSPASWLSRSISSADICTADTITGDERHFGPSTPAK